MHSATPGRLRFKVTPPPLTGGMIPRHTHALIVTQGQVRHCFRSIKRSVLGGSGPRTLGWDALGQALVYFVLCLYFELTLHHRCLFTPPVRPLTTTPPGYGGSDPLPGPEVKVGAERLRTGGKRRLSGVT